MHLVSFTFLIATAASLRASEDVNGRRKLAHWGILRTRFYLVIPNLIWDPGVKAVGLARREVTEVEPSGSQLPLG